MIKGWNRLTIVIVSLALLVLTGCDRRPEIMKAGIEKRLAAVDSLFVSRPNLSTDGRYVVFDVQERFILEKRVFWSYRPTYVALYDLQDRKLEILAPFGQYIGTNSASFDFSDQYLVMATTCFYLKLCSEEWFGNHIVSLNLKTRETEKLSTPGAKYFMWAYRPARIKVERDNFATEARSVIKGFPIYSPDRSSVYYYFSNFSGSHVFGDNLRNRSELRRLRKVTEDGKIRWIEEPAVTEDRGVAMVERVGLLSMMRDGRILMPMARPHGLWKKEHWRRGVRAYFFKPDTEEFSVVFDKNSVPKYEDAPIKYHQFHSFSHSASQDGRRISFNRAQGRFISLWEDGKVKDILTSSTLGLDRIRYTTLSGDGKWLIIFPHNDEVEDRQDVIWRMNVDTGAIEEIPLRAPLRRAMNKQHLSRHILFPKNK